MSAYRVIWEIDVEADSPVEAAREALDIQRDVDSTATFFEVTDKTLHVTTSIDLEVGP